MTIQRSTASRGILLLLVGVALVIGVNAQSVPEPPSGLVASINGNTVTLVWNTSAIGGPVQSHIIEAGSAPGASDLGRFPTGPATSVVANNVATGTLYVRVRAVNNVGPSGPSNEVTVTVGSVCGSAPTAPGPLVSSVSGSSVQLSWGGSSGPVSTYVFEIGSTSGATNLGTIELGSAATTFATSGVAPGTYFVRVKARNPCGLSAPSNDTVVVVGGTTSGGPQLQIINSHAFVIEGGRSAGRLAAAGEVINTGGSPASMIYVSEERFSPAGSRLGGSTSGILGRSRRVTNSGEIDSSTLGPGETGCFLKDLGPANTVGRYELRVTYETFPTAPLQGRLEGAGTWRPFRFSTTETPWLLVFPTLTNVGTTPTAWNRVAFVAKDSAGRVVSCASLGITGKTNSLVPGYGVTNVILPGELAGTNNGWQIEFVNVGSIASLSFWGQWKE